jgi:class 3 adenylate cyclase
VSHTGDGFFAVFDTVPDAVEAAAAIQRRLADQRREHGFAPSVRIGIHLAEATAEGSDFRGQGVHAAARVGSVADADEIVISAAALDAAGSLAFPVSMPTTVELKGIREPMPVHRVDWRQVAETD